MRTFFLLSILVFGLFRPTDTSAQLFDSIGASFNYKPKFLLKFDSRTSFVSATYAKMKGVKVGLDFNKTTRVGIG